MKQYTKDGIILPQNKIVLREEYIVELPDGTHREKVQQIICPSHETLIAHGWEEVAETTKEESTKRREAHILRRMLSATDYRVIKCMEAYLCGEELPYDIAELHAERNAQRSEINKLEEE